VLYVPATGLESIMKYSSADGKKPKINKLGTQEWTKTTAKVKSAVSEIATELVDLYAARTTKKGYSYSPDTLWQREFEELFPFDETGDQLEAIEATKRDMESSKIMDRLICGDVGYGKTEIAIRAAFKAVQDGKQVAFLVPTTILAEQHYNTFVQRMKDFPVHIELLSRFVPQSKQKKTLAELKTGMVDIVIGTHRILSKDLEFKDLGLLIIDEEQRFGVSHKEKVKQMKEDVDVLTLTATPIPRTLHMSLVGIRDMSVLEEPPNDRLPIQTYVMEYNEELVREAINRELSRSGQVYYVYNRVNTIADVAAGVQRLVPEANVAFAHGQMKESELERIMYDFVKGDIDVLVATTIIETGLDIPNVNTMIIHDSDQLGLSQLYQLRGRVGRSNRTSFAFLMYKRDKMLQEIAEKRLQTIRDFTDLGSGYKIAMRDLEIRGAGNILGMSQHGHMEAVGYDMYCKLLNQAVLKQKGETVEEDFSTSVDLDVDAFIPPGYILNEIQKLDIYKRIAGLGNSEEIREMEDELKDRFGDIPESATNLLRITDIRLLAHSLYLSDIKGHSGEITFIFRPDAKIKVENLDTFLKLYQKSLTFDMRGVPTFKYVYIPVGEVLSDERKLLETTKTILTDMVRYLAD
ncbi:MAG: transcription-repair coupling factor, partial [Lachnospiraceae bacterium]|nr:transcription-repair coupling factor [Lachnospiraceae bacterium]